MRHWMSSLMGMVVVAAVTQPASAQIQSFYELNVRNNFGAGEYYGATPTDADIWLLTNFQFDYKSGGSYVTGNGSAGTYAAVQLSAVEDGSIRLYPVQNGTRMYAVLSQTQPTTGSLDTAPNNYWEWSFDGSGNPGTLDLSWIDSWDFLSRMQVNATGTTTPAPTTVTYGAGSTSSTQAIGGGRLRYLHRHADRPAQRRQRVWRGDSDLGPGKRRGGARAGVARRVRSRRVGRGCGAPPASVPPA